MVHGFDSRKGVLSDNDHREMDTFLAAVFEAVKSGDLSEDSFTGGMAQVIAAVDIGNVGEARSWFKAKADHFKDD